MIVVIWGEKFAAAVVASIFVTVGLAFIIAGHRHKEAPKGRGMMATVLMFMLVGGTMGASAGLLSGIAFLALKRKQPEVMENKSTDSERSQPHEVEEKSADPAKRTNEARKQKATPEPAAPSGTTGIVIDNSSHGKITGANISGLDTGIKVTKSQDIKIVRPTISGTTKPENVPPDPFAILAKELKAGQGNRVIVESVVGNAPSAQVFGNRVSDAFESAGWVVDHRNYTTYSPEPGGIVASNPDAGMICTADSLNSDHVVVARAAFKAANITCLWADVKQSPLRIFIQAKQQ